jgi:hypothetical protein
MLLAKPTGWRAGTIAGWVVLVGSLALRAAGLID